MPNNLIGLRASHYEAMAMAGLSEREIDKDWEQVEKDMEAMENDHALPS